MKIILHRFPPFKLIPVPETHLPLSVNTRLRSHLHDIKERTCNFNEKFNKPYVYKGFTCSVWKCDKGYVDDGLPYTLFF